MPRGDGTGPAGAGPMSGRAAGYCAGFQVPGFTNPIPVAGAGFGRGRGFGGRGGGGGRGWRHRFYATGQPGWMRAGTASNPTGEPAPESETAMLHHQVAALREEIDTLRKRLGEAGADPAEGAR